MNILIVFATYSGSTMTAAQLLEQQLQGKGHQVGLKAANELQPSDFDAPDLIILASPSWDYHGEEGMPHEDYQVVFQTFAGLTFPGKKFAIMGLGDSNYTVFCGSATHLENWVDQLQGQRVIESLRIDQYFFNEAENNQKISAWADQLSTQAA